MTRNVAASSQAKLVATNFIGGGVLATSLIDGLLRITRADTTQYLIRLSTRRPEHAAELQARYPGVRVRSDNRDRDLWSPFSDRREPDAHVVLICTQPGFTKDVCDDLRHVMESSSSTARRNNNTVYVTMCPGIRLSQLESWLPPDSAIVRTMPNTSVSVNQGATAMFANRHTSDSALFAVKDLFRSVSPEVCVLPDEDLIDVSASISGSGPAHIYLTMASLIDAGVKRGLPYELAAPLVKQAGVGACALATRENSPSLQSLIDDVCVPGGSTEKAMRYLKESGVPDKTAAAVDESLKANKAMSLNL